MKRALLGVTLATLMVVGAPWALGSALAAPTSTAITLQCSHGVNAAAQLDLWAADGTSLGHIDITCGPDSGFGVHNGIRYPFDVATVDVTSFTGTWGSQDCAQPGLSVPINLSCPTDGGPGARLTIR